ncbi:glycosyltransferase family 2 protein [Parabacteroides leei]|uniref:glycosyltransferase family 2 protein n=1 Tax=Parabacteroides leei TaxID=2939491 RepID=UPI0021D441BB|nr:glycosyltransferase family 2 protein [Parabacteroides leei]
MISVVINTFNAEKHLEEVLESVKEFDEIILCDMYSTDRTIDIAQKYNCTIIYHEYTGYVEPARQYAVQAAKGEWIFIVDADEVVPKDLRKYLYEQIKQKDCPDGIKIPRKNYFMGRFMRCTYPDYILRFFRKEKTTCPPEIHRQPKVSGKIGKVPASNKSLAFIHLANDSVKTILNKANNYTEYELDKREKGKYGLFSLLNGTIFRFFKLYILKGAILDGKAGLAYAGLFAFYKYITIAKIWEKRIQYQDLKEDKRNTIQHL